jgi:hypothetical protein
MTATMRRFNAARVVTPSLLEKRMAVEGRSSDRENIIYGVSSNGKGFLAWTRSNLNDT